MSEHQTPPNDRSDEWLLDVVDQAFGQPEDDSHWEATKSTATTAAELRDLKSLYDLWQIFEFNRRVMRGEDPSDRDAE